MFILLLSQTLATLTWFAALHSFFLTFSLSETHLEESARESEVDRKAFLSAASHIWTQAVVCFRGTGCAEGRIIIGYLLGTELQKPQQ